MTESALTELEEVNKRFFWRAPLVLDSVSLSLRAGSKTTVVGSNGSGKSTLLRVIAGVARPTSGRVVTPRRIGLVPERLPSIRMTGAQYIAHMGRIRSMSNEAISKRATELFDRFDLRPNPEVPFESLSKGNRQKVILTQAFLAPVDLLVLDEPFSGLDAEAETVLNSIVAEAQDSGTAVIMSVHLNDTDRINGELLRIERGQVQFQSPDPTGATARGPALTVELECRLSAPDLEWITTIPTARSVNEGRPDSSLIVEVAREDLDRFLLAAIHANWSVLSVGRAGRGSDRL